MKTSIAVPCLESKTTAWQLINTAPRRVSLIMWGPGWLQAGEGAIDDDGTAYCPSAGIDLDPQPTHWQIFPDPPVAA